MQHLLLVGRFNILIRICLLLAMLACLALFGCSASPRTWDEMVTRRFKVPVQSERLAARADQGLPGEHPLIWNPRTDRYNWKKGYKKGDYATTGDGYDLAMRHPDFPNTYISEVHVSLDNPEHLVYIVWAGPQAGSSPAGPWRSTPGAGQNDYNCDNVADSNTLNSNCTPKGIFRVKGFSDHLQIATGCRYATWVIHKPRLIAIHTSVQIPDYPASGGCIRMPAEAAKLIHNNSIAGVTLVSITGKWADGRYVHP